VIWEATAVNIFIDTEEYVGYITEAFDSGDNIT
jgi:hypothetical protein